MNEFFDRLKANDPASNADPDLTNIKARIDAHTADNILPMTRRSQYGRSLRIAAAVGALALAGGIGFAGGNFRAGSLIEASNREALRTDAAAPAVGGPQFGIGGDMGGSGGAESDAKVASSYVSGYWGAAILKPTDSVSNAAGQAQAFSFSAKDLDSKALALAIANSLDIDSSGITQQDGGYSLNDNQGAYHVFVSGDSMAWFSGYVNARSPWSCGNFGDGGSGKEPSVDEQQAAQDKCDAEWPTPSKADAIKQAKVLFESLGLVATDGARYSAYSYSSRLMTVVMTPLVDGMPVGNTWQAEVGKAGVFSVNGYAARLVKSVAYPTVGARDAAARSELRKWQAFGPQALFNSDRVYTMEKEGSAPTLRFKDGKPMLLGSISEVSVNSAERGLMQVWLADGTSMMMPAWNFAANDGSTWQMLAITDEYIDWTATPGGPVAYDTARGM